MTEIKQCPFCGGINIETGKTRITGRTKDSWHVGCPDCGVWYDWIFKDEAEAVAAWNYRDADNWTENKECRNTEIKTFGGYNMKYIDADALDTAIIGECWYDNRDEDIARDLVEKFEAADVVPVVRCVECKHYNTTGCSVGFGWCESMGRGASDEFFCSCGAKMGGRDAD
ncbi:MAG TPA: Lar family restriction alleviation protein [Anaerolineaceae bacterium]|nr:Lar family restriction alleviation protein [Clostridia bacterium]HPK26780.1 Lar family restriction alleviation protein [Anaerolineaceae bacterium]